MRSASWIDTSAENCRLAAVDAGLPRDGVGDDAGDVVGCAVCVREVDQLPGNLLRPGGHAQCRVQGAAVDDGRHDWRVVEIGSEAPLASYLRQWDLELEGDPWSTPSSYIALVRRRGTAMSAVLKVPLVEEERRGSRVLDWWAGDGAARVYAIDDHGAILMERATPGAPLRSMAESASPPAYQSDVEATRTLVAVAQRLHRQSEAASPPDGLMSLQRWFRELFSWAHQVGGYFLRAATIAEELLDHQQDCRVLHGDIHHENVLWFGSERGWLAIDSKGLFGDAAFDYVNLLTNPSGGVLLRPGRFEGHVDLISSLTGIVPMRLLRWTVAWAGLSAAWHQMPYLTGRPADVVRVGLLAECALRAWS